MITAWRQSFSGLIAAALCVIATTAVLFTAPVVVSRLQDHRSSSQADPLAPGLAALHDQQLLDMLPKLSDFDESWRIKAEKYYDRFGYFRHPPYQEVVGVVATECSNVDSLALGAGAAAQVSAYRSADASADVYTIPDIEIAVDREFDPSAFEAMISLVNRCLSFTTWGRISETVQILEDSRPANGAQRFRISITETWAGNPPSVKYLSFARLSRLVLTGRATAGYQQTLDALFDNALRRIGGV